MHSLMFMMHSQIKRAFISAIRDRVIPEIQNMMRSLSSGQRNSESRTSTNNQECTEEMSGLKTKLTKNDSRSALDLRDTGDLTPYMVTGVTDTQQPIPQFWIRRIYFQPNLERQESAHNVSMDKTLPMREPEVSERRRDQSTY